MIAHVGRQRILAVYMRIYTRDKVRRYIEGVGYLKRLTILHLSVKESNYLI
jgi:hypothetical protein